MGLKEGTLESLVKNWKSPSINTLTERLVHQMLQALDCLSAQGIVHRDVKPDNILYVSWPDGHHFQLGDFGLSNRAVDAKTFAGTPRYMAPEMFRGGVHSHKADVWSLFVTTVWMLNPENFREEVSQCVSVDAVYKLLSKSAPAVINIQEMGRVDPEERASAAQMLIKLFNGEGLTTPRNAVQAIGAAKASVQASPPSTTSQPIRRVSPGSCLPQRTGRFHIERLRGRTRTLRQDIVSGQHPK
jgi:serine/threonine protein kinase